MSLTDTDVVTCMKLKKKIIKKCKVPVIHLHFMHFINTLIDNRRLHRND